MIIDAHAHIFPSKIAEKAVAGIGKFYSELTMEMDGTVDTLIENGKKNGIEKFVVQSVATTPSQVHSINDFIAESVKEHPDELVGFATLHPDCPDLGDEIARAVNMSLKGIKLHPDFQRFNLDCDKAMELFKLIEGKLAVLIHMGDYRYEFSKPKRLARVMDKFPNLKVIGAHFGGWSEWKDAEDCLAGRDNLWVDTSSSLYAMEPERAKELIEHFGADKVLFGTDYPMWEASAELERFNRIPLTEEEREMILHENAEKLLNL